MYSNVATEKRFYKPSEIGKMFGVDRFTIYGWQRRGILNMQKINGRFYATEDDIRRLFEQKRMK